MIDIHSHVLPGVDDGAQTIDEAMLMLEHAASQGVERMVLTPHLQLGRFDTHLMDLTSIFESLKQQVAEKGLSIDLALSSEVRLDADIMMLAANQRLPLLGEYQGQRFMLLELPHSHVPAGFDNLIKWLASRDIRCVIAHPERNRDIQKSPFYIEKLKDLGCWLQVTASSLLGDFGDTAQQLAQQLVAEGDADIVASDCHSMKRRPPKMAEAYDWVQAHFGEPRAFALFKQNPARITESLF